MKHIAWTADSDIPESIKGRSFHLKLTSRSELPFQLDVNPNEITYVFVTSKYAAHVFKSWLAKNGSNDINIITFSSTVQKILKGYSVHFYSVQTASDLMRVFMEDVRSVSKSKFVFLGAEKPAFDFKSAFARRRLSLDHVICYRTEALTGLSSPLREKLQVPTHVSFAAPSAVRVWAALLEDERLLGPFSYSAIGPTTATACREVLKAEPIIAKVASFEGLAEVALCQINIE